jgi:hypothetical protein
MRTKSLLITAALGAASIVTSMAQTVYSVNIVGYINLNLTAGYQIIANQLTAADNTIGALIPAPPDQTAIFKYNRATLGYDEAHFADGAWDVGSIELKPGEATFINVPSSTTVTFVGEVKLVSSLPVGTGYTMLSSVIPQSGLMQDELGFPVQEGDNVFKFNKVSGGYDQSIFSDGAWDTQPFLNVGEGVFVFTSAASHPSWDKTFTVGP